MSAWIVLRTLVRSRAFTFTSICTITLAVSLAAVVFAVVDGVLFKPLPYPASDRLFAVSGGGNPGAPALSPKDVEYLRGADPRIAITSFGHVTGVRLDAAPETQLWSVAVERNFFDVVGRHPLVGGFTAEHFAGQDPIGMPLHAIVSYPVWRDRLGSDISAIGRALDFVGRRVVVVGVLPHDFVFPDRAGRVRPDVLFPLRFAEKTAHDRWARSITAIARIEPGLPADQAHVMLSAALAAHVGEYPPRPRNNPGPYESVNMRPLDSYLGQAERPLFRLAFGGALLLVLLGCVNVGSLLAARGRDRERELAIRVAIGARGRDIARLLLLEATLLAAVASILGVVVAAPLLRGSLLLLPDSLLLLKTPAIDWRVMAFAISAAVVTMTLVSVVSMGPVLRLALTQSFAGNENNTPRMRSWTRMSMLALESAIGITLVVAGSLIVASFINIRSENVGFEREGLAVLEVMLPGATTPEEQRGRHARVLDRIEASPSVKAVAMLHAPLMERSSAGTEFAPPPGALGVEGGPMVHDIPVSGRFFEVAGLHLRDGRLMTREEAAGPMTVAVVSEGTARKYWPGTRAVGQVLDSGDNKRRVTVIGVVVDAATASQVDSRGSIYLPASAARSSWTVYLIRTARDPQVVVREIALAVNRQVEGVRVRRAESFERALAGSTRLERFQTLLFGTAAAAGLVLLSVGIAGLVAMSVARRLRELGIRTALGARRRALVTMIVLDHLRPVVIGTGAGLIASWWTSKLLSRYLYEIEPHDLTVWVMAVAGLFTVAVVASWIPAARASRVDPAVVLRAQ
jgi:putative ABC transport system permease protein